MSSTYHPKLQRRLLHQVSDTPVQTAHVRGVLQLLLAQDGSTTRLCEAVAEGPVALHVLEQRVVDAVPAEVNAALPGTSFIERITSLAARGEVMMDNLSYIALEGLPAGLRRDIDDAKTSIGHLLSKHWVRRSSLDVGPSLYERLWGVVGLSDANASRAYCIVTPDGPRMLIVETYRRGVLMGPGGPEDA